MKSLMHIFLIIIIFINTACKDWLDVNHDPENPEFVDEKFALSAGISSLAFVYGGRLQVLGALWSQHWTQSPGASQYSGLDAYDINSSTFDNSVYVPLYAEALKNLEFVKVQSEKKQYWNYYFIATIMQCYIFQLLVDLYDEIPFTDALKGDEGILHPKFEKGQDIYDSLLLRIEKAQRKNIFDINLPSIGKEDLLFNGNINNWMKFSNTLKLKILLRQIYARREFSLEKLIELMSNPNVKFIDIDVAMNQFVDETGRSNPLYESEIRTLGNNPNLVLSYTFFSFLSTNNDYERLNALFNNPQVGGPHKALIQGNFYDPEEFSGINSTYFSKPKINPDDPVYLMSLSESLLMQCEAIIRTKVRSYQEAKLLYEKAIDQSFIRLLSKNYSNDSIIKIARKFYSSGMKYEFPPENSEEEDFIKSIIIQKWIALAGIQSIETFFEHNRTHFPSESKVPANDDSYVPGEFTVSVNNVTGNKFPKRLILPMSEISTNPNVPQVKDVTQKIWWDKKEEK